jgi:phosphopantothenoylcysteine decarboxylase/phosphopantothenate--cysteine ligase
MAHIDWARDADLFVVAPASANTLSAAARGEATDMLTTLMVAYDGPIVFAPAMNPSMWASDSVRNSLEVLHARGHEIVEPDEGSTACGEHGQGRLATLETIISRASSLYRRARLLQGKLVLITSGATREPIDSVRFLSNRSSGKMGAALAKAAVWMGAEVIVVAGPSEVTYPQRAQVIRVETAQQMLEAAIPFSERADFVFGVAAVADFRPAKLLRGKPEKEHLGTSIPLVANPDVIQEIARRTQGKAIGFAAEHGIDEKNVREKMRRKGLFAIAANDVSQPDVGMGADYNQLTLFTKSGNSKESPRLAKLGCAFWLIEALIAEAAAG